MMNETTDTYSAATGKLPQRIDPSAQSTSWSYVFMVNTYVKTFQKWMDRYNAENADDADRAGDADGADGAEKAAPRKQPYFVHQTYRYAYRDKEKQQGVRKTLVPTISGLVFLQGTVKGIQGFLKENFPQYHLVNDCSTGRPASIPEAVMRPFMGVMETHPERVTFLREPFEKFARDRVKLRVLTGAFKGYEGYIVRIDRDRQLVFDFGGYAVAIRGVHNEDFEVAE